MVVAGLFRGRAPYASAVVLALAACSSSDRARAVAPAVAPASAPSAPAAPPVTELRLPTEQAINTPRFANVVVCARCHTAGETQMRDRKGRDVSPVADWRASMMGLAGRDPYFLAALRREITGHGERATAEIEGLCLRCHSPTAHAEATALGRRLSLDALVRGTDDLAELARGGVDCAGCHAIEPATLGSDASFTASAPLRTDRVVYGLLEYPRSEAMLMMSKTEPRYGEHLAQSALCGSCHTVLVPIYDERGATGRVLAEQTTYLEWRASAFADGPGTPRVPGASPVAASCQACHMPLVDDDGAAIVTPLSTRPPAGLPPRPMARHLLAGGSAYLLEQLAEDPSWLGAPVSADGLRAAARASRALLAKAAGLRLAPAAPGQLAITVVNQSGHKLPTGYPSRRMWLEVVVHDQRGGVLWASGRHQAGAIVDSAGQRLDGPGAIAAHRDRLGGAAGDAPIIWEAVPVDANGRRTHLQTRAERFVKDNRILPLGWRAADPGAELAAPRGVEGDADFVGGRDTVTLALPAGAARVRARLLYQAIPPETIESYRPEDGLEAQRFLAVTRRAPEPEVLAQAEWTAEGYLPGAAKP